MNPHPDELVALLALPSSLREALAECDGPGWWPGDVPFRAIREGGSELADPRLWTLDPRPEHTVARGAWLPADSAAILDLVPGEGHRLERSPDGRWCAAVDSHATGWLPTARLAALRLLAEVSGG